MEEKVDIVALGELLIDLSLIHILQMHIVLQVY